MSSSQDNSVSFLKLVLHDQLVGYLTGYRNGKNIFNFSESFRENLQRPSLSLSTLPKFPHSSSLMAKPWVNNFQLHPIFSNVLPEGSLRDHLAQQFKIHTQDEFKMLAYLGHDLPGALIATPLEPNEIPSHLLSQHKLRDITTLSDYDSNNKFSLAGIQMKFSMKETDHRFTIPNQGTLGDWIIKTPSTKHKEVPINEYSCMKLTELAGITIPKIRLIEMNKIDHLPPIFFADEQYAYAIQRFDRHLNERIHIEDFAQVLLAQPQQKYQAGNYSNIAEILYRYSSNSLSDTQEFANRLLVNILLANGDAHLKNWSLIYPDKQTPQLAPAYDILTTSLYFTDENQFALNLAKNKYWYQTNLSHFEHLARNADVPWINLKQSLIETLERARNLWPDALKTLPFSEQHKEKLLNHWKQLHPDFQI